MNKLAYIFAGRNGLDQAAARANVLRIPEVSLRVREAQTLLDQVDLPRLDLHTYISADDDTFLRNIKLKSLAAAIVQVGLYERALKYQTRKPDILAGNSNGDSALNVVAGRQNFQALVQRGLALMGPRSPEDAVAQRPNGLEAAPLLAGLGLAEYEALTLQNSSVKTVRTGDMDFKKLMQVLIDEQGVDTFVTIGPCPPLVAKELVEHSSGNITLLDSIELDPMLTWFWRSAAPARHQQAH